ncbi:hypothetical protein MPTK1_2g02100 [Marchantia polymorpha subsp. ruderalis]|uniref:Uncharacterized protein n=1 Tax=Marchantia polymorpha TaxID=3197 RepID=A0A2R6W885_MARPO|nr:hypothetical protein MARPO_0130s0018 [Marchantia polymorpha]BBN00786.1 hypothetical protein Mp_2g02100 [Marchantia polymorpha subsp. ruderalis]|eukprot:PTQ30063.1 hypothetical protein MARPO_0130s0018 [Marchantia polymorpha]
MRPRWTQTLTFRRSIPFSAFWLRSSVVSVLISLISDTRVIDPHDINLIYFRVRVQSSSLLFGTLQCRLGIALPPRPAQPTSPHGEPMKTNRKSI